MAAGAVRDPQRLSAALGGLYVGWLSVQGVLRVQFAKTINLALSCSQCVAASCAPVHSRPPSPTSVLCGRFVEYYVCKLLLPLVAPLLSTEFRAWLPVGIKTGTKASLRLVSLPTHTHTPPHLPTPYHTIPYHTPRACVHTLVYNTTPRKSPNQTWVMQALFVYFAWKLQEVVSAAQSGLRGGLLFSRGVCAWLNRRGHKSFLGLSLEPDKTYLDEAPRDAIVLFSCSACSRRRFTILRCDQAVGYVLAALGFYVQWQFGFGIPFPFSLVMLPLDAVEWYVRWSVTSDGANGA